VGVDRGCSLLGACCGDVDPGQQLVTVIRKGTRAIQSLPASPDAFVWLRLYQSGLAQGQPTGRDDPLWWTRRRPFRPLTYHAARAMFVRATGASGANWTLHDLRHTAAYRMARGPQLPLTDVQWVLGHTQLTTTQLYLTPMPGDVIADVLAPAAGCVFRREADPPAARLRVPVWGRRQLGIGRTCSRDSPVRLLDPRRNPLPAGEPGVAQHLVLVGFRQSARPRQPRLLRPQTSQGKNPRGGPALPRPAPHRRPLRHDPHLLPTPASITPVGNKAAA